MASRPVNIKDILRHKIYPALGPTAAAHFAGVSRMTQAALEEPQRARLREIGRLTEELKKRIASLECAKIHDEALCKEPDCQWQKGEGKGWGFAQPVCPEASISLYEPGVSL